MLMTQLFISGNITSIKIMLDFLQIYHKVLGQKINIGKIQFLVEAQTSPILILVVTGFRHQSSPFKYLGVPIFQGRWKIEFFDDLVSTTTAKIDGWASKLLSKGGKLILINHVLRNMPIYHLLACIVPKWVIEKLESRYYCFLWGIYQGRKKKKWKSWETLSLL